MCCCNLRNFFGDPVDRFIRQILGAGATSAGEDLYELAANLFVFLSSLLRIRVEPGKQLAEGLLVEVPLDLHGGSLDVITTSSAAKYLQNRELGVQHFRPLEAS